jgi:F-type H+-transporting ATPase subunit b
MVVLTKLYYKPIGDIVDKRESKIEQETLQLGNLTKEIEERTTEVEHVLAEAKRESKRIKEDLIKDGEVARERLVADTKEKSLKKLEKKMLDLDNEFSDAERKLEKEIVVFSNKIKEIFT